MEETVKQRNHTVNWISTRKRKREKKEREEREVRLSNFIRGNLVWPTASVTGVVNARAIGYTRASSLVKISSLSRAGDPSIKITVSAAAVLFAHCTLPGSRSVTIWEFNTAMCPW